MRSTPWLNRGPHFPNWALDKSPVCKPSITASAASSPDLRASKTPDEYNGSRNPNASPISTQPSPATCRERYE